MLEFTYDKYKNVKTIYSFRKFERGRRGRDRMVVWFTTTCASSAYHHNSYEFELVHDSIQYYVIKFVSDLRKGTPVSSNNKTDRHDITKIMLKVALNTITQTHM
jgi:hypothetical protein